jgi:hypothetical protein
MRFTETYTNIRYRHVTKGYTPLLSSDFASEGPQTVCIRLAATNVVVHTGITITQTDSRAWRNRVCTCLTVWDHDVVSANATLLLLTRTGEDLVEALTLALAIVRLRCHRHHTVAVRRRAFDDGPGPLRDETVRGTVDLGRDPFAFGVEEDDAAELGLFEYGCVDPFEFRQRAKELLLNVEGWQ